MGTRRLLAGALFAMMLCGSLVPTTTAAADFRHVAATPLRSVLAVVTRALSGSFTEVYRVSGEPEGGTVSIAQHAPAGRRPSLTGDGEWSFVYQNDAGYASQWVERGRTAWDCWRPPGAPGWTCSGPGQFRDVNGYLMAVSPFVPGDVLGAVDELEGALTSTKPAFRKIAAASKVFESDSRRFGPLRCLRVAGGTTCADRRGVVVSSTGAPIFGSALTLVRYGSAAPESAFALKGFLPSSGLPFVALHQPYVE
jgi:hypothetical protein